MKPTNRAFFHLPAALVIVVAAPACFGGLGVPSQAQMQANIEQAQKDGQVRQDAVMKQHVEDAIAKAETGGPREAAGAAAALTSAYQMGSVERGGVSSDAMVRVLALLDREMKKNEAERPALLAARGRLELASGQRDMAIDTLRESMDVRPTLGGFLALAAALDEAGKHAEIVAEAKRTLPEMVTDDDRYEVLFAVIHHTHASSAESGLAWASVEDRKLYAQEKALRDEEARIANEQHRREQEEASARMRAEFDASRRRDEERSRCSSRCDADFSTCKSRCGFHDGHCRTSCEDASRSCRRSCG